MNEKKWFVYLGDHHEGPFSVEEVRQKMAQGLVSSQTYVWAEGMADWQVMTEVSELQAQLAPPAPPAIEVAAEAVAFAVPVAEAIPTPTLVIAPPAEVVAADSPTIVIAPKSAAKAEPVTSSGLKPLEATGDAAAAAAKPARRAGAGLKIALALLVPGAGLVAFLSGQLDAFLPSDVASVSARRSLTGLARPLLTQLEQAVPSVGEWLSPISRPDDVAEEDFRGLRLAASGTGTDGVNSVGVALAKSDPAKPALYVAADLPDGALFEVVVRGVPGTLLNQTSFERALKVTLMDRLGRSGVVQLEDGRPVPKGEYDVIVFEAAEQSPAVASALEQLPASRRALPEGLPAGRKLTRVERLFLGGERDAAYAERLKEFHDRLKQRAATELGETKQFADTLESQLGSSAQDFERIAAIKAPAARRKAWNDFHGRWTQLMGQLTQTFTSWSIEALQNEYFYPSIYMAVQQAGQAVTAAHQTRHEVMTGAATGESAQARMTIDAEAARSAVAKIKELIVEAETRQQSAGGIPQKL